MLTIAPSTGPHISVKQCTHFVGKRPRCLRIRCSEGNRRHRMVEKQEIVVMSAALLLVSDSPDQTSIEDEALATGSLSYLDALIQSDPGACSTRQLLTGILEGFCTLELARRHTTTLFHELGSFAGILEASYERIRHIIPISREFWIRLQTIRIGTSLTLRESIQEQPLLADLENVHQYLALTIGQDTVESVRLLVFKRPK